MSPAHLSSTVFPLSRRLRAASVTAVIVFRTATMPALSTHSSHPLSRNALIVVITAGLVLSVVMGIRQTFGLFINPFSYDRGLPVTIIAFAIALHNLVWGFAQPFAGAAADRYGATPVVAFGAATFAGGLALARSHHRDCCWCWDWACWSASASAVPASAWCWRPWAVSPHRSNAAWRWASPAQVARSARCCWCRWHKPSAKAPASRCRCSCWQY